VIEYRGSSKSVSLSTRARAGIVAAALASAGIASAASLRISPIGVDMPSTDRAAAITLANIDSDPVNLQVRIFKWSQIGGEDKLEPTDDLIVSPPFVTVPAGASYTIRIARPATAPVGGERSYRLLIDELPKPVDPRTVVQGVQMVLRTSMPVFIADKAAVADLSWKVWRDAAGMHARVINNGQRHAKIAGLTVTPQGGAPVSFGAGLNGYVLPGATRQFDIAASAGVTLPELAAGATVTISAKNDALDIKAAVPVGAP
jgi:fimbrial chaperone protein